MQNFMNKSFLVKWILYGTLFSPWWLSHVVKNPLSSVCPWIIYWCFHIDYCVGWNIQQGWVTWLFINREWKSIFLGPPFLLVCPFCILSKHHEPWEKSNWYSKNIYVLNYVSLFCSAVFFIVRIIMYPLKTSLHMSEISDHLTKTMGMYYTGIIKVLNSRPFLVEYTTKYTSWSSTH